jgi:nucleoside-diphosphate-sugar epimerase
MLKHLNVAPVPPARVVVVGANGFVGGAVARCMADSGVETVKLGRAEVDLLLPDAADKLAALMKPGDALVAASAMAPVRDAAMLRDNMTIALALVSAASAVALNHVVNIGSDALYSDSDVPLTEESPTAPDNLHGVMHFAREAMIRNTVTAPLAFVRPTLIYGAGDPHNGYGPNRFRRLVAQGKPITLFGNGEERRDHVYVDDVAELVRRILVHRSTGTINAVSGVVASFRDIAEKVVALSGRDVPILTSRRNGPMPHNGYRPFDAAAIRQAFPDFAITPLDKGLALAQRGAGNSAS